MLKKLYISRKWYGFDIFYMKVWFTSTYCITSVYINVGLQVLQDFVQMTCSRSTQEGRITVGL